MCNYVVGTGADSVAAVREYGAEWWSSAVPVRIRTHTGRLGMIGGTPRRPQHLHGRA